MILLTVYRITNFPCTVRSRAENTDRSHTKICTKYIPHKPSRYLVSESTFKRFWAYWRMWHNIMVKYRVGHLLADLGWVDLDSSQAGG